MSAEDHARNEIQEQAALAHMLVNVTDSRELEDLLVRDVDPVSERER